MQLPTTRLQELARLIEAEQDRLFRFAYMRIGNRSDAEDIVQDVFLKLFSSDTDLSHVQNLTHYLTRSIHNACHDYHRKHTVHFLSIEEANYLPDSDDDRDLHEEYLRISRLLELLPPEQAELLRLKCVDGLKFKEIADLLDIPEGTAKSRYRYAKENIQKFL